MPPKRRTHHAILGLLCWKPMSGYDIKKMVEVGLTYFWSESYGQIFPTLNRLVEYHVTPAGRLAFKAWLHQPTDMPRLRDELKLKFFLTSRSETGEGVRLLEEYREQQRDHLAMLKESEAILAAALQEDGMPEELHELRATLGWNDSDRSDEQTHELLVFFLTLRSGVRVAEARVAWVEEVLPILQVGRLPDSPS